MAALAQATIQKIRAIRHWLADDQLRLLSNGAIVFGLGDFLTRRTLQRDFLTDRFDLQLVSKKPLSPPDCPFLINPAG